MKRVAGRLLAFVVWPLVAAVLLGVGVLWAAGFWFRLLGKLLCPDFDKREAN